MRIDLNAKVRTRDGKDAGSIERAVFDSSTDRISHFVVGTGGLLGRSVLVPTEDLERASRDGDVLQIHLTKDELERLPEFTPAEYSAPPEGWIPPTGYGYPAAWYLWPTTYSYPGPPVGLPETAASRVDPIIDRGAPVVDSNGEDIGTVEEVQIDPDTGKLRGVTVRAGGVLATLFGGGKVLEVGMDDLQEVESGLIRLRMDKEQVERIKRRAA